MTRPIPHIPAFALVLSSAIALSMAALAPTAHAQDDTAEASSEFDTHLAAALEHYEGRRYIEAAAEFRAAFALRAEPELQYNIARSLERGLQREDAIEAYDAFIALPGTTSEMRARALSARDSLRGEITAMAPPTENVQETPSQGQGSTGNPRDTTPPPAQTSSGGGGLDLAPIGWTLFAVGAGAAIVGAIFGGLAISSNNAFEDTTDRDDQVILQGEVRRFALLADILIGAGAAVGLTGVIFLIVQAASGGDEDTAELQLTPTLGPNMAGLSLSGGF